MINKKNENIVSVKLSALMDKFTSSTRYVEEPPLDTLYAKIFAHFKIPMPASKQRIKASVWVSKTTNTLIMNYVKKYFRSKGIDPITAYELAVQLMTSTGPSVRRTLQDEYIFLDKAGLPGGGTKIETNIPMEEEMVKKKVAKKKVAKKAEKKVVKKTTKKVVKKASVVAASAKKTTKKKVTKKTTKKVTKKVSKKLPIVDKTETKPALTA